MGLARWVHGWSRRDGRPPEPEDRSSNPAPGTLRFACGFQRQCDAFSGVLRALLKPQQTKLLAPRATDGI